MPPSPGHFIPQADPEEGLFKAQVFDPGYVSLVLRRGIRVNVGPYCAIQILNPEASTNVALSGCATQMALTHPQGRVLQYNSRIEVQCPGKGQNSDVSAATVKSKGQERPWCTSAKIWPRGISFTSSNCAITYLVDEAGTRSTSDYFFNLFSEDYTESKNTFFTLI